MNCKVCRYHGKCKIWEEEKKHFDTHHGDIPWPRPSFHLRTFQVTPQGGHCKCFEREEGADIDFGDYVIIEQKRYGAKNEMYLHKVINTSTSNTWVDVPVESPARELIHNKMEPVVSCICCGVSETEVLKYRINDIVRRGEDV